MLDGRPHNMSALGRHGFPGSMYRVVSVGAPFQPRHEVMAAAAAAAAARRQLFHQRCTYQTSTSADERQ